MRRIRPTLEREHALILKQEPEELSISQLYVREPAQGIHCATASIPGHRNGLSTMPSAGVQPLAHFD